MRPGEKSDDELIADAYLNDEIETPPPPPPPNWWEAEVDPASINPPHKESDDD